MNAVVGAIIVSVISAVVGPVILLLLGRMIDRRLGKPNGQGNVTEMLERSLRWQGRQDDRTERMLTRLGRIEAGQRMQDARLDALEVPS